MDKLITFNRQYFNSGTTITFDYKGTCNNSVFDIESKYDLIDKIFNGYPSSKIMDIVRDIRTIFKDFTEEHLTIFVVTNSFETSVKYLDGKLVSFSDEQYISRDNKLQFNYELDKNINFSILGNTETNKYIEFYNMYIGILNSLKNILPISIYHNEELLCKVYKLFYGINPDFCDKNINIKIQTMISILTQFNICLNYPLSVYSSGKMPQNINLTSLVYNLRALGEVDVENLNTIKLTYSHEPEITEIGKLVRESNIDTITLSKLVHAGNYDLSEKSDIAHIRFLTKCDDIEIEDGIQLVKRINKKIK